MPTADFVPHALSYSPRPCRPRVEPTDGPKPRTTLAQLLLKNAQRGAAQNRPGRRPHPPMSRTARFSVGEPPLPTVPTHAHAHHHARHHTGGFLSTPSGDAHAGGANGRRHHPPGARVRRHRRFGPYSHPQRHSTRPSARTFQRGLDFIGGSVPIACLAKRHVLFLRWRRFIYSPAPPCSVSLS